MNCKTNYNYTTARKHKNMPHALSGKSILCSLLNTTLAVVLAFGLVPFLPSGLSYADESDGTDETALVAETNQDAVPVENSEIASTTNSEVGNGSENGDMLQDDSASDVQMSGDEKTESPEEIWVDASEALDFVYIENNIIALGEQQNIAIGFIDDQITIESATLDLVKNESGDVVSVESDSIADNAILFSKLFTEEADIAGYSVAGLHYVSEGVSYYIEFNSGLTSVSVSDENSDTEALEDVETLALEGDEYSAAAYAFDVVSPELLSALDESAQMTDEDVSVLALDEEGGVTAAESVEEALAIAAEDENEDVSLAASSRSVASTRSVVSSRENYLVVAIDPGHGGYDGGASANGLKESSINLSIAKYFQQELSTYSGVTAYMTRTTDEYVGLSERVNRATKRGADVFISVHCNSSTSASARGSEVWVPNNSSYLNSATHGVGYSLGSKILDQLTKLGLQKRGVYTKDCTNNERYPDGSLSDYFTVIDESRRAGIPGIIVEHAFVSNASDASYLGNDSNRKKLGIADATGVAQQYNLVKDSTAKKSALVSAEAHVANLGWESAVYDGKVAGTTGKSLNLEAFQLNLQNAAASAGGIQYRSYVNGSWQSWAANGATSGTTGQSTAVRAIQVQLTGDAADQYDVFYRVHIANKGWLPWTYNGETAGTTNTTNNVQAIEFVLVSKGTAGPDGTIAPQEGTHVYYQSHVQSIGWQGMVANGALSGTTGKSLRVESLKAKVSSTDYSGGISMRSHVQDIGWTDWTSDTTGTTGKSLRMEAVQLKLTGDIANYYDIYYRTHVQNFGWTGWAKNGENCGSAGYGYRMEAIEIVLVEKGGSAPGSTSNAYYAPYIKYQTHVQSTGWQSLKYDGAQAGTTGSAKRLEAIKISLGVAATAEASGGVSYRSHVQNIGWETSWKSNGALSGTEGQSKRLEAIQIKLTGDIANKYDIYYRVHVQNYGWMGWAKNGESAGTQGYSYRLEAIQIQLVEKGGDAPGSTANAFKNANESAIMGSSQTTATQMAAYFKAMKGVSAYPSIYASKGASTIDQFCAILMEEAQAEGVRAEVVFCQAMKETGWLQYGGDVKANQCNFCGLGATGGGAAGATFSDVRQGLRAQVQHLKAYASTAPLKNACVDPRFNLVMRGIAPNLEDLDGRWAAPGIGYGASIKLMISSLLKY